MRRGIDMANAKKHKIRSKRSHHNKPDFSKFILKNNSYMRLFKSVKKRKD